MLIFKILELLLIFKIIIVINFKLLELLKELYKI